MPTATEPDFSAKSFVKEGGGGGQTVQSPYNTLAKTGRRENSFQSASSFSTHLVGSSLGELRPLSRFRSSLNIGNRLNTTSIHQTSSPRLNMHMPSKVAVAKQ